MQNEFNQLIKALNDFEGIKIVSSTITPETIIVFRCLSEASLARISLKLSQSNHVPGWIFRIVPNEASADIVHYQLVFTGTNEEKQETFNKLKNTLVIHNDLGIPSLELITIRQMADELKRRHNLCFALVWIEDSERDNIAIEGSGNPTQLIGLLSRGVHMAIDWADKKIQFEKPT